MRFTTSEGGLHQQNGMVENTVRYVKQRARTLLFGAKLPQRLWPQAVNMAATLQRASVLGMETRLAAPFGAKVLVRRREYGRTAEPGKPDDLAPRWLEGYYLGLSETLRRGHIVYLVGDDGEKFVPTVNIRAGTEEPPSIGFGLEADLQSPPSRRLRAKVSGGGDVVVMSKARTVVGYDELKSRAVDLLADWSQEEAESLIFHVALSLDVGEQKYGVFRHGGQVGSPVDCGAVRSGHEREVSRSGVLCIVYFCQYRKGSAFRYEQFGRSSQLLVSHCCASQGWRIVD